MTDQPTADPFERVIEARLRDDAERWEAPSPASSMQLQEALARLTATKRSSSFRRVPLVATAAAAALLLLGTTFALWPPANPEPAGEPVEAAAAWGFTDPLERELLAVTETANAIGEALFGPVTERLRGLLEN